MGLGLRQFPRDRESPPQHPSPSTSPQLTKPQYEQYELASTFPGSGAAAATSQAEHGPPPPIAEDPSKDVFVTGGPVPPPGGSITEEKIEYRDENGNLLDAEQVAALQGAVSFSTRYETRTRLVDEHGNELLNEIVGEDAGGYAGTSADGVDPGTANAKGEGQGSAAPPRVGVKEDVRKEKAVNDARATAEPESEEVVRETGRDEL